MTISIQSISRSLTIPNATDINIDFDEIVPQGSYILQIELGVEDTTLFEINGVEGIENNRQDTSGNLKSKTSFGGDYAFDRGEIIDAIDDLIEQGVITRVQTSNLGKVRGSFSIDFRQDTGSDVDLTINMQVLKV